jgi:hypothetical protein
VTANPLSIAAAFFVGGIANAIWNVITVSLRQRVPPDRLLGRVNSGYGSSPGLSYRSVPPAGGLLAQAFGLHAVFVIAGLVTLALVAGMTKVTDQAMDAAERDVDQS